MQEQEYIIACSMQALNNDLNNLRKALINIACNMYYSSFDIIGSQGKAPRLHKWSDVKRDILFKDAMIDFNKGIANSINLRMTNSALIALDFDIPNDFITMYLMNELKAHHIFKDFTNIYTCRGKKGLKIFVRYKGDKSKLKNSLGLKVMYENAKYELEIKKQVATIAGLYNDQGILYSSYATNKIKTKFICNSKSLNDIEYINDNQLKAIEHLYNMALIKCLNLNTSTLKESDYLRADTSILKAFLYLYKANVYSFNELKNLFNYSNNYYFIDILENFIKYLKDNKENSLNYDKELLNIFKSVKDKALNDAFLFRAKEDFKISFKDVRNEILTKILKIKGSLSDYLNKDVVNLLKDLITLNLNNAFMLEYNKEQKEKLKDNQ